MRFWDPLATKQEFSLLAFLKSIRHPKFLLFIALTLVLFFATDPSSNRPYVPLWGSAAIWPIAYLMYITLYLLALTIQSLLTGIFPKLRVPTSLLGFIALFPTVYVSEAVILEVMSGGTYPEDYAGNYLFYFLSVQVCEAVFFRYIFPTLYVEIEGAEQTKAAEQAPHVPSEKYVIIGGERIPLDRIHVIEARQHHVHVTFSDSQRQLRARMGDIVAQTSRSDGVQTHRSWWVARHMAESLDEADGRPVLKLKGDKKIPIARTRIADVELWVAEHLDAASAPASAAE